MSSFETLAAYNDAKGKQLQERAAKLAQRSKKKLGYELDELREIRAEIDKILNDNS